MYTSKTQSVLIYHEIKFPRDAGWVRGKFSFQNQFIKYIKGLSAKSKMFLLIPKFSVSATNLNIIPCGVDRKLKHR